ncbi:hypothetical protein BCR44DRAFT_331065 [Catenaria anguillulae PL171]|uniref:Uncharacterized protein n=1 Tax=Catenaria anguillulae PL171 TaxID=765915 RepID=A0A1Y2HL34_9FUNG|nr:hypothetical protein BCR44DRAFT_331065 [Catenaria anguillulae PL171]
MSSEYSDDFEEYTDDFEAYDSDKDEDTGADHHHVSPSHGHRQQVPSPQPPLLRPSSAAKTITNSASPTRGGLIGASPATNGVRAPTGFGLGTMSGGGGAAKHGKSAATAESARVKAIRKLVTFEYVNFTLLDMPPKSRYELALLASARVDGGGNRFSQKETQTGSDLIELAVQTEEVSTASVETQCPDDVVIVAPSMASGSGKEGKKDKKKASTKRTNSGLEWTPQLTKFVMGASQVFDSIMSAAAASDTVVDEVHDPHAGLVELFTIPIPMGTFKTFMHY